METLKLYHPSCTSCSFDGVQYDADEDGAFEVPPEAVAALVEHGFTGAPAVSALPAAQKSPVLMSTEALLAEAKELGIDPEITDRAALVQAVAAARKAKAEDAE